MPTAGPNNPSAYASVANGSTNAWSNVSNIAASDNAYATAVTTGTTYTDRLRATDFGFSIPSDATINGILLEIEVKSTNSQVQEFQLQLTKDGTSGTGTDRAYSSGSFPTSDTYKSYGSTSDLWGLSWTPAEINSANFGMLFAAIDTAFPVVNPTISVDHVRISVTYSLPATGGFFGLMRKAWKWLTGEAESKVQSIDIIRPVPALAGI